MSVTRLHSFDASGFSVLSSGTFRAALSEADRLGARESGLTDHVPLVYLHRDYHADERSPKLLDVLYELQHCGPVHALRISCAGTASSARRFVQALLELFPMIVVLEDLGQGFGPEDSRFLVLSAPEQASCDVVDFAALPHRSHDPQDLTLSARR